MSTSGEGMDPRSGDDRSTQLGDGLNMRGRLPTDSGRDKGASRGLASPTIERTMSIYSKSLEMSVKTRPKIQFGEA